VRQNLSDPAVATNDRVPADAFDLTALFEFSNDFQNFSFCNETNDFTDDENDGAVPPIITSIVKIFCQALISG